MANDQQLGGNEPQPQAPQSMPPALPAHGAKRRRLAKAGLGAAGVLWTLESHATLNANCATPSAFGSMGLKHSNRTEAQCNPQSPSSWVYVQYSWPCNKTKLFSEVFSCQGDRFKDTYSSVSMFKLMSGVDYDDFSLGCHLTAAYLNVVSGRFPSLDVPTLQRMWNELMLGGLFKVGANQYWTAPEVREYFLAIQGK